MRLREVFLGLWFAAAGCTSDVCYNADECNQGRMCFDPLYLPTRATFRPVCPQDQVHCGGVCTDRCEITGCARDRRCEFATGCCVALSCREDEDCHGESKCRLGRCRREGRCLNPSQLTE